MQQEKIREENGLDGTIWKMRCRGLYALLSGRDYLVFENGKFFSKHLKKEHGYTQASFEIIRNKRGVAWSTTLTSTKDFSDVVWMGLYIYGSNRMEGTYTWMVDRKQKVRSFLAKQVL